MPRPARRNKGSPDAPPSAASGEWEIDGFRGDEGEDFEAVALEDLDVMFFVVEGGRGEG